MNFRGFGRRYCDMNRGAFVIVHTVLVIIYLTIGIVIGRCSV